MPSPFPGMDPYLEDPALWPDVHHEMISVIRLFLNQKIRPKYFARVEERVYISDENDPGRQVIIPDVRLGLRAENLSLPPMTEANGGNGAETEAAKPVEVTTLLDDEIREAQVQIIEKGTRQVVTVIEVLSPTNKIAGSRGRKSYLEKRREILLSSTQLVEIDLLRAGLSMTTQEFLPPCDYQVYVHRKHTKTKVLVWPIRLRQPLPRIPIPLWGDDPDVDLDLGLVLQTAYDNAGYEAVIDYRAEPIPPLSADDRAWAMKLLDEKGVLTPAKP